MAKQHENLPLELLNKHRESLGLKNPVMFDSEEALFEDHPALLESAVVFLPKSRPLINMTLALVSGKVIKGGTIVLAGTNDAGIGSAKKAYETNIGAVDQKIIGNHSALYVGKNHRLGANKSLEDFLSFSLLPKLEPMGETSLEIASLPGVFSTGELDEGTKLLLEHIPYTARKVLDIGCGAGIVGAVYKKKNPESTVTFADASLLALEATKQTLKKNNLEGAVVKSDVFSHIPGSFDLIITNPPFHTGISTDYTFMDLFSKEVRRHLENNSEVYVVANSFLPYKELLEKHIGPTTIIADTKKFRVYKSVKS